MPQRHQRREATWTAVVCVGFFFVVFFFGERERVCVSCFAGACASFRRAFCSCDVSRDACSLACCKGERGKPAHPRDPQTPPPRRPPRTERRPSACKRGKRKNAKTAKTANTQKPQTRTRHAHGRPHDAGRRVHHLEHRRRLGDLERQRRRRPHLGPAALVDEHRAPREEEDVGPVASFCRCCLLFREGVGGAGEGGRGGLF